MHFDGMKHGKANLGYEPNGEENEETFHKKENGFTNLASDKNGDVDVQEPSNPEVSERGQWGNSIEFLMSCIAMSIGLGNIWRFPFVANQNGGGAFLIPYLIVLTVIGRPMYYMEMALGQFSNRGNVQMFQKLSPVLKGIGYGQLIGLCCVATYYCAIMAITLYYFFHSFTSNFQWAQCKPEWDEYLNYKNLTCVGKNTNLTEGRTTISSAELYFKKEVLKEKDNIEDGIGNPDWRLTLLLLASWVVICLVTLRGVKSSGKASYFLALFPYVIMITLLIRAATLEGAADGMYYFIETDWNKIYDAEVWYAAVTQCFFSLNVGFGEIVMLSSYNEFSHNINKDAIIITTLDTFTSLLSGITIFGILGNLAHEMGVHPREVLTTGGGTGLAFISYPDAIAKFEHVPWLFAILFFFMLFTLGVGSQVACHGSINTVIKDSFPKIAEWKIALTTAAVFFLIGLVYCTPGGQHVLELVDHFGGTLVILPFAILEVTAVAWLYGIDNFCMDLEFMTKRKVGLYWRLMWGILTPCLLIFVFVYFLATLTPLEYGMDSMRYPTSLEAVGWLIFSIAIAQMVIRLSYYLFRNRKYPLKQMLKETFSFKTWVPEGEKRLKEWKMYKSECLAARPKDESIIKRMWGTIRGR